MGVDYIISYPDLGVQEKFLSTKDAYHFMRD
jgi:hypothetical protein